MDKKKVLIVMGGSYMGVGGIESMIINYYRNLNKDKLQIDFVFYGEGEGLYDDEIRANGGRLFHLPIKSRHPIKSKKALENLLKTEKYDIVHANLNAAGIYAALKVAKKCKIKTRIAHAHSSSHGTQNRLRWHINDFARSKIKKYSTHNFACSDLAGDWYFGKSNYIIIPNAVDAEKFIYNKDIAASVKTEMAAKDKFVIGHIGNLGYPKNQAFLIDVYFNIVKKADNTQLWLIGEGEDLDTLKAQSNSLGIASCVKFLGRRNDVHRLLQGIDVFVLPSFFEGFPVVIPEAVASDAPCVVSDTITKTVMLSKKVKMLSLDAPKEKWCDEILDFRSCQRENNFELMRQNNFDIKTAVAKLENFYMNGSFN